MDNFAVSLAKEACPACGKIQDGPILLNTRLTPHHARKVEELHGKVIGFHMCPECQGVIDGGGVFLVEIDPAKSKGQPGDRIKPEDACRTGRSWGIKREAVERIFGQSNDIMFIDREVADKLGLPDPEPEPVPAVVSANEQVV